MNADELRSLQAPLKEKYKTTADAAVITLTAKGELDRDDLVCRVETGRQLVEAGLHPATGGSGAFACSGNMLLEALVACAGVTLKAVSTAIGFALKGGSVSVEGDLDFRPRSTLDRVGKKRRAPQMRRVSADGRAPR